MAVAVWGHHHAAAKHFMTWLLLMHYQNVLNKNKIVFSFDTHSLLGCCTSYSLRERCAAHVLGTLPLLFWMLFLAVFCVLCFCFELNVCLWTFTVVHVCRVMFLCVLLPCSSRVCTAAFLSQNVFWPFIYFLFCLFVCFLFWVWPPGVREGFDRRAGLFCFFHK